VPALIDALKDTDAGVRQQVAWALGAIGDRRAVDPLTSALSDSVASGEFLSPAAARNRYVDYLTARVRSPRAFVTEATEARGRVHRTAPLRVAARR